MIVMVIEISDFLSRVEAFQYTIFTQKFHSSVSKTLKTYSGEIHRTDNNNYVVTFKSVTDAVQCALEIKHKFKYVTPKHKSFSRRLNIALSYAESFDEKVVLNTTYFCELTKDDVVITEQVKEHYQKNNAHAKIDKKLIRVLQPSEQKFLVDVMTHIGTHWNNPEFNIQKLSNALGLSYSKIYWRLTKITGKTPNNFIKDYRLHEALEMLHKKKGNINKIAERSGFKSATYFSDCFLRKYGVRPSKYLQQHT